MDRAILMIVGVTLLCMLSPGPDMALVNGPTDVPVRRAELGAFMQGLLNNLLNPKGALFYLGVFTQLIVPGTSAPQTAVLIAAMVATSALFWLAFVWTLQRARVRETLARSRRSVERVFGAVLIALGVRVAAQD